jgi:hypothetical protein
MICTLRQVRYTCNYNNQVKEDEVGGACSAKGGKRNAYGLLVG